MCTPSPRSASPSSWTRSRLVSRSSNSWRMRSRFSSPDDVLEQVGLAAHDQALLAVERARPGGKAGLDHLLGQLVELGLGGGLLLLDPGPGLVEAEAADAGVEVVAGLDQARRGQARRQGDDPVLHVLVLADQHHQRLAGLQLHELDVLELAHLLVGQHDAGACDRPEIISPASVSTCSKRFSRLMPICASMARRSSSVRSPTSSRPSTNRRRPDLRRQAAGRGVRRIDEAQVPPGPT